MIDRQEIMDFSREFGLTANVIEKDYVLGWVLSGISNHAELGSTGRYEIQNPVFYLMLFDQYLITKAYNYMVTILLKSYSVTACRVGYSKGERA